MKIKGPFAYKYCELHAETSEDLTALAAAYGCLVTLAECNSISDKDTNRMKLSLNTLDLPVIVRVHRMHQQQTDRLNKTYKKPPPLVADEPLGMLYFAAAKISVSFCETLADLCIIITLS